MYRVIIWQTSNIGIRAFLRSPRPISILSSLQSRVAGGHTVCRIQEKSVAYTVRALGTVPSNPCQSEKSSPTSAADRPPGKESEPMTPQLGVVELSELQYLISDETSKYTLIDVRTPEEISATGLIPTAGHVPLAELPEALDANLTSQEDFKDQYGFDRPAQDEHVIFYCRVGVRSEVAGALAVSMGYRRVDNFKGSWLEWNAFH